MQSVLSDIKLIHICEILKTIDILQLVFSEIKRLNGCEISQTINVFELVLSEIKIAYTAYIFHKIYIDKSEVVRYPELLQIYANRYLLSTISFHLSIYCLYAFNFVEVQLLIFSIF